MYRTRVPRKELDLGGVTELRVHGVGGSSPEQVLDVPYTDLVSGDLTAGFFAAPAPPRDGPERRLEAYSWGGLTSRSRLPGALVAAAPLRPGEPGRVDGRARDRRRLRQELDATGVAADRGLGARRRPRHHHDCHAVPRRRRHRPVRLSVRRQRLRPTGAMAELAARHRLGPGRLGPAVGGRCRNPPGGHRLRGLHHQAEPGLRPRRPAARAGRGSTSRPDPGLRSPPAARSGGAPTSPSAWASPTPPPPWR